MIRVKLLVKTLLYLCSLYQPIRDAFKGVSAGIKAGQTEKRLQQEYENRMKFMDDIQSDYEGDENG